VNSPSAPWQESFIVKLAVVMASIGGVVLWYLSYERSLDHSQIRTNDNHNVIDLNTQIDFGGLSPEQRHLKLAKFFGADSPIVRAYDQPKYRAVVEINDPAGPLAKTRLEVYMAEHPHARWNYGLLGEHPAIPLGPGIAARGQVVIGIPYTVPAIISDDNLLVRAGPFEVCSINLHTFPPLRRLLPPTANPDPMLHAYSTDSGIIVRFDGALPNQSVNVSAVQVLKTCYVQGPLGPAKPVEDGRVSFELPDAKLSNLVELKLMGAKFDRYVVSPHSASSDRLQESNQTWSETVDVPIVKPPRAISPAHSKA
jgi:hypothetical protein